MLSMDSLWERLWPSGVAGSITAVVLLVIVKGPKFWASAMLTRNRAQQLLDAIEERQLRVIERRHRDELKAAMQWRDELLEQREREIVRLKQEAARLRDKLRQQSQSSESRSQQASG